MTWLVAIGLANAVWAVLLAGAAVICGRWLRRPALAHLLWIVVLAKLFAPPVISLPLGDWLGRPSGWLSDAAATLDPSETYEAGFSAGSTVETKHAIALPASPANEAADNLQPPSIAGSGLEAVRSATPISARPDAAANIVQGAGLVSLARFVRVGASSGWSAASS